VNQYTIDRFSGLQIQPNSLTVNPGTFEILDNAVVSQDFLITKSTGYFVQFELPNTQIINRLFDYQNFSFCITQNTVFKLYQTPVTAQAACTSGSATITVTKTAHGLTTGNFISQINVTATDAFCNAFPNRHVDFAGRRQVTVINPNTFTIQALNAATASVTSGATAFSFIYYIPVTGETFTVTANGVVRSRTLPANKNLYFTSDGGVMKLEGASLPLLKAGIPPGLDIFGFIGRGIGDNGFTGNYAGILLPKASYAYRVLFGRRDANNNFVLGAPSQFTIVNNSLSFSSGTDFSAVYAGITVTVTQTAHGYSSGQIIYLYDATTPSPAVADGTSFEIVVTGANTFTFDLPAASTWPGTVSFTYYVPVVPGVQFSLPSEVNTTDFIYQIYRSSQTPNNAVPPSDYKLLFEANVTSTDLIATFVEYYDTITDLLIDSNAQLYTNPTQEGELQANNRPPRAKDVASFRNYSFFSNNLDYGFLELALQSTQTLASGGIVTFGNSIYEFRGNATNEAIGNSRVISAAVDDGAGGLVVTQNNHGFVAGDVIYVQYTASITGITPGLFTIFGPITANTFKIGTIAAGTGSITYQGVFSSVTLRRLVRLEEALGTLTVGQSIDNTARFLVEAVNRNPSSNVYAFYTSSLNGSPGKFLLQSKTFSGGIFAATAGDAAIGGSFSPELPTVGTSVSSEQEELVNQLSVSKLQQPEAVPLVNNFLVGTQEAAILRILPLRDSLIILKEDGVYRLNGTDPNNFIVTLLDSTVICRATESAVVLNNSVYCFSNQGVVQITDSAVRIISRPIEPYLTSFVNNTSVEMFTAGIAYESERWYFLSIVNPNSNGTIAEIIYVFNYINESWSSITLPNNVFFTGRVSSIDDADSVVPSYAKYLIAKERKNHTKIDYTGDSFPCETFISLISTATASAGLSSVTVVTKAPHGFIAGQKITVSEVSGGLAAAFSGGAADLSGIRIVTAVNDLRTFTFTADSSASVNVTNSLFVKGGISELSCVATTSIGSRIVFMTTTEPHGLISGDSINVQDASANIVTTFSVASNVTGTKSVIVLSPTTFTFTAAVTAAGSVTGTVTFSDGNQDLLHVTLNVASSLTPQEGDSIILGTNIYKTDNIIRFSPTQNYYLATLQNEYTGLTSSQTFLNSAYTTRIKLTPVTAGNPGLLKYIPEFQTSFRNQGSCSALTVNFSNDAFPGTSPTFWNSKVGSARLPINFGGWGQQPWGDFPWGGGTSIEREYNTSPAVVMRIYVPKETFCGTFIQPIIVHKVAGEPLEIQSMSLFNQLVSPRTTK